jgi:putative ABC transport system permease protein
MQSLRIASRLAWRNLRRRPGQAALLLVTLTIATGTLAAATWLYGSADGPWDRVWKATNGFHVSVAYYHDRDTPKLQLDRALRKASALGGEPGVVAVGGPWTLLDGHLDLGRANVDLTAEIRKPGRSPVDQPLVTAGRWLAAGGGIVLESGLASTLHVGPGGTVAIQGRPFPVRGVAETVSVGRFPLSRPAQVWVTPQTGREMRQAGMTEEGFDLQLRLTDPGGAPAFAVAHRSIETSTRSSTTFLETWEQRRADSHSDLDVLAEALLAAGGFIAVLTVATAAVIVTGRMAAETRRVGTLKAIGVTPRLIIVMLLIEYLGIAALATTIGLGIGRLLAPRLAATSLTILGPPEPPLSWPRVGIVAAAAAAVVLLGTIRPAVRGIRHSTLRSLQSSARGPKRPSRLARLAARIGLPVTGVLGLRSAWRRPGRLLTNAAGLALGIAMIVVALGLTRSLDLLAVRPVEHQDALSGAAVDALYQQVRAIILGTAGLLLVLGTINAFIVATFAARDSARNHAVMRAMGATPRQTVATLIVSQFGACALAIGVGIPLGLGLWQLMAGGDLPRVEVPWAALLALLTAVPVAFAGIVSVPALWLARRPIAPQLAYE